MADGSLCQTEAAGERRDFYVYLISRPNGTPCYVGKGRGHRWKLHRRRAHNPHLRRIYSQSGGELPIQKVIEDVSEAEAHELERFLIHEIGREDLGLGPLVNFTDGGEGMSGYVPSEEQRQRQSQKLKGRKADPAIVALIASKLRGRKRGPPSEETRRKIGLGNLGKFVSAEARAQMSAYRKGRKFTEEHKRKIGESQKGKIVSEQARRNIQAAHSTAEARETHRKNVSAYHASLTAEERAARAAKISAATKLAMANPEVRAKISAARSGKIIKATFQGDESDDESGSRSAP